jgi:AP-3 complex subunit delta-1
VAVRVELSQMEGGGGSHGSILAHQMMDVAIRVAAIRPFATRQMALLVESSAVILARGRRNSSAEVLYAAGWVVGEFCEHLEAPAATLQAMLRALETALPAHIQAVFIQNSLKLWAGHCLGGLEAEEQLAGRLEALVVSGDLEVQERASSGLHLLRCVLRQREKGEQEPLQVALLTLLA